MDHAEVLARLEEAAATPGGVGQLQADQSPAGAQLNEHLENCPDCRAELAAWQLTSAALLDATPDDLRAPADARERILAAVVRDGVPRGAAAGIAAQRADAIPAQAQWADPAATSAPLAYSAAAAAGEPGAPHVDIPRIPIAVGGPSAAGSSLPARGATPSRPSPVRFRRLALAAAAVLVVFVAGALLGPPLGLTPKDRGVSALVAAVAASDQILQVPGHREAVLARADGARAGSVLVDPSTGAIVVLSGELDDPNAADYHCYLVRDGAAPMWIGPMRNQDGTSYWAGTVTAVTDLGRSGDVIQVMDGGTAPELTATF